MVNKNPQRSVKMPVNISLFELEQFAKKNNCVLHMNHGDISLIPCRAPIKKQAELTLIVCNQDINPATDLSA